jgi:hypothetical protein
MGKQDSLPQSEVAEASSCLFTLTDQRSRAGISNEWHPLSDWLAPVATRFFYPINICSHLKIH